MSISFNDLKKDDREYLEYASKVFSNSRILKFYEDGKTPREIAQEAQLRIDFGKKQQLCLDTFETWLAENGITIRKNVVTQDIETSGLSSEYDAETLSCSLHTIIHDRIKEDYKCTSSLVADLIAVVAGKERFNPVLDVLSAAPEWDGKDRFPEIYQCLNVDEKDFLSRTLIRKWFYQCLSLQHNDLLNPFGSDGLLVLNGDQGIGKTYFAMKLFPFKGLVKTGNTFRAGDKDSLRQCTTCFICELGEIESTLKSSDHDAFKAFITQDVDEYRLPYARNTSKIARRTSFIATCNTSDFIVDTTGSRRFWTIPVNKIDRAILDNIDILQFWKQVETEVAPDLQCFRLSADEKEALSKRNTAHEKALKGMHEVRDIINEAKENPDLYSWKYANVTQFKSAYSDSLHCYSSECIGKALTKLGIISESKRIDGVPVRNARYLPFPDYMKKAKVHNT